MTRLHSGARPWIGGIGGVIRDGNRQYLGCMQTSELAQRVIDAVNAHEQAEPTSEIRSIAPPPAAPSNCRHQCNGQRARGVQLARCIYCDALERIVSISARGARR